MLGESVGKTFAGENTRSDSRNGRSEPTHIGVRGEQVERSVKPRAGFQ
jgi:hypothetical protein